MAVSESEPARSAVTGVFIGLITVDSIYLAEAPPAANQKRVADDFTLAAGGPAANAAVAFAYLGGAASVIGALGRSALAAVAGSDLGQHGVRVIDLMPATGVYVPLSSVVVSRDSGARAVISRNAGGLGLPGDALSAELLDGTDVILVDGHQMAIARAAVTAKGGTPLVVDAGSWKPGFDAVLRGADHVICSADFRPPGCSDDRETIAWLQAQGIPNAAISHGAGAISYYCSSGSGRDSGMVEVPEARVVDTLGAGDFLHGAFCRYVDRPFPEALARAAAVASRSCGGFGTRSWMNS